MLYRYVDEKIDYPDIQLMFSAFSDFGPFTSYVYGIEPYAVSSLYENITENVQAFGVFPLLLRPRSRGYIKLKSIDPNEAPVIVPNYFDDPYDLQVLVCYASFYLTKSCFYNN